MKRKHFVVAGLPRSRTTWLSILLSGSRSRCLHDPLRYVLPNELRSHLEKMPFEWSGIACTGIGLYPEAVADLGPVVVVERHRDAVIESVRRRFGIEGSTYRELLDVAEDGLREIASWGQTLSVPYDALSDIDTVRRVWNHLLPGVPVDDAWIAEVMEKHIEIEQAPYLVRMKYVAGRAA